MTTRVSMTSSTRPAAALLRKIVDPWEFRQRLTQPKLVILGTNDRYWPLDACDLYWNDLQGEKHLIYVPNNGHGLPDRARLIAGINAAQSAGSLPASRCRSWIGASRTATVMCSSTLSAMCGPAASSFGRRAQRRATSAIRNGHRRMLMRLMRRFFISSPCRPRDTRRFSARRCFTRGRTISSG